MNEYNVNPEYTLLKKANDYIYLSQEQMDILDEYEIDYRNVKTLSELIYKVEKAFEENDDDVLNNLLDVLSERNYYENFNK